MHIVLLRNGSRALILPAGEDLATCPPAVRRWLGQPISREDAELTERSPRLGVRPPTVLAELLQNGFCALDGEGVVQRPAD